MATTTGHITWKEFEALPDGDGFHREVLEGDLIVLPPVKSRHSRIARRLSRALAAFEEKGACEVHVEAGYQLSDDPPTWLQPDVSVLGIDRARSTPADGYFRGSPELAIEIVSPSETARDLNRKIDVLLASGALAVWVVYPEEQEVRVFVPGGNSYTRRPNDVLSIPELLADFELPVAQIFDV